MLPRSISGFRAGERAAKAEPAVRRLPWQRRQWHGYVTIGTRPDGRPDRRHREGKTEAELTRKVRELVGNTARWQDLGGRFPPHRDVGVAVGRERLTVPAGPSVA